MDAYNKQILKIYRIYMKEKLENTRLNLRVPMKTKEIFLMCFENSNFKKVHEFLLSLLGSVDSIVVKRDLIEPKKENVRFGIRVTANEKAQILKAYESTSEKRIGMFILKCIKNTPFHIQNVSIVGDELKKDIRKIGSNINQIALKANQTGVVDRHTIALLEEIKAQLFTLTKIS